MMQHDRITKYRPFPTIDLPDRQWPNRQIQRAPIWCSVDLRDGNQALAIPMGISEKLEMFALLCRIGFKQIEVGFPSASETEFNFCRKLIEEGHIPDDVTIQVLVQAREHLIRKTFEALEGAPRAILHLYNSTNPLQRRVTFNMSREQIREIAVAGTRLVKELACARGADSTPIQFQYSPESFSDTELDFSLEVCEAVCEAWDPDPGEKLILNLPATVELATPNVHADQIEYFCRHFSQRERVLISLHTHNDQGTGIAATELGLMAGADRVEGTLFGNGERTGNLDVVTAALNLYSQGIEPNLDFSDLPAIREAYERLTRMSVHERHPYAGDLVFTAFSGSHQDAIKKGIARMPEDPGALWQVPYLPIDPKDIGRTYKAIIRINSQSGKGGVAYVLESEYGLEMPRMMYPEFGAVVARLADRTGLELTPEQIRDAFYQEYIHRDQPLKLVDYSDRSESREQHRISCSARIEYEGETRAISGSGNGPIAAFVDALKNEGLKDFRVLDFRQHSINRGSGAAAIAYLQIERQDDKRVFFGAGIDTDIELAGIKSLVSAFNRARTSAAAPAETIDSARQAEKTGA